MSRRSRSAASHHVLIMLIALAAGSCSDEPFDRGIVDPPIEEPENPQPPTPALPLSTVINDYRASQGLPRIPLSGSLTQVAEAHVLDLALNSPAGGVCNLHSWSAAGNWTPCCYTADHAQAACMWNKPREITDGVYTGYGFEIASSGRSTPEGALQSWQSSAPHHSVILNQGVWASHNWRAMGAAMHGGYAVVWFGRESDPAGPPP